jgi:hypothetical protein
VSRAWPGATAVVLGSGPSLTAAQVEAVRGLRVIAVNDTFRLCPWADVLYACDKGWWDHHTDALQFAGLKVSGWLPDRGPAPIEHPAVRVVLLSDEPGYSNRPDVIRHGANSGHQALQLAAHFGASTVILLGLDMRFASDGRSHFFGDHPDKLRAPMALDRFLALFEAAAPDYAQHGVRVINATPESALTCFPMMSLEAALCASRS